MKVALKFKKTFALMLLLMGSILSCSPHEKSAKPDTQTQRQEPTQSDNVWKIEPWPMKISIVRPGSGLKRKLTVKEDLPNNSMVFIQSRERELTLIHSSGAKSIIFAPGIFFLDEKALRKNSEFMRTALDVFPSNLLSGDQKQKSISENLLAFFVPRVPFVQDIPNRINGADDVVTQPIKPVFPPAVYFIETPTVPVQVNLEWIVERGQVDPHSVYLWSENRFVNAPTAIVRGGQTNISLSNYGRYYWQVEDATGRFVSTPRTLIVVKPGGTFTVDEEPKEEKEPNKKDEESEKEKTVGGMQLLTPVHRTNLFGCRISRTKPIKVPVQLHLQRSEFEKLSFEIVPNVGIKIPSVNINENQTFVQTSLPFFTSGSFELKPFLHSIGKKSKIPLSIVMIQLTDICKSNVKELSIKNIEELFDDTTHLPSQGRLDFTPLTKEKFNEKKKSY